MDGILNVWRIREKSKYDQRTPGSREINVGNRSNNVPCTVKNVARTQPSVSQEEDEIQNSNFERVPSKRRSEDPEEDDRKPAAKRIKNGARR